MRAAGAGVIQDHAASVPLDDVIGNIEAEAGSLVLLGGVEGLEYPFPDHLGKARAIILEMNGSGNRYGFDEDGIPHIEMLRTPG
jgi:hypothetical protein